MRQRNTTGFANFGLTLNLVSNNCQGDGEREKESNNTIKIATKKT